MALRRLIVLFVLLTLVMGLVALRLWHIQVNEVVHWQTEARTFIDRPHVVETTRGTIVDRTGRPVALDTACYDLAINYRALSLDDRWITQLALTRMRADGLTTRAQRRAQLHAYKDQIADQIMGNPARHMEGLAEAIARQCHLPPEEVQLRFQAIAARITMLRQSRWLRQYDRASDEDNLASGAYDLDAGMDFKEEQIAHTIVPAVTDEVAFYFQKHLDDYPGLVRVDATRRSYPYGATAAHVIGVLRRVDQHQLDAEPFERITEDADAPRNLHGYLPLDRMGGSGVERMLEPLLRGTRGMRVIDTANNRVIAERSCGAVAGQNVQLTLDIELQRDLEKALQDPARHLMQGHDNQLHPVALVILDAADSTVLSMVSLPGFDLNTYDQFVRELLADQANRPLLNRAVQGAYPPGSTVKGLVAAAALSEKLVTPDETVVCNGHLFPNQTGAFRCWIYEDFHATHGPVHLVTALEQSCNIYFYTMGQRLGYDRLATWYRAFGFGAPTGVGLGEESGGRAPTAGTVVDPEVARREAIFLGIGQGPLQVTPLQMANAYATLLRGGVRLTPRIIANAAPGARTTVPLDVEDIPAIKQGLFAVVNGIHGTAHKAMAMKIAVAGKTGTATAIRQVFENGVARSKQDDDAWFIGYVPADAPKYVIAAVMEFGGHGGAAAAPMAKEAIMQLERHGYLPALDVETTP